MTNVGPSTSVNANLSISFGSIAVDWSTDTLTCTDDVCIIPDYETDDVSSFIISATLPASSERYFLFSLVFSFFCFFFFFLVLTLFFSSFHSFKLQFDVRLANNDK